MDGRSLQLHRGGGLGGDVVEDAVDALDLVHDAAGDGVEQLPRQTRKVGGHEVLCLYRAQRDGVIVGALVAHDADRAQVCERGEILVDAALKARLGDLLAEDGVRLADDVQLLLRDVADDAETASFQPSGSWTYQLEIDAENKTCICRWHVTPEYYTDTYRPDGNGGLYLARRDTEVYYSADGVKSFTEVYTANEQPLAYADLDRDGEDEILVLATSEPDEFAKCRYTLEARKYNGTVLFTKEVTPYYTGWDTFFLCYGEDENGVWGADVLCYQTHEDGGVGSCSYDLISYAGGRERYLDGNTITFVLEADGAAPVPDIDRATQAEFVRFREGVASLLEGSSYLLFCSGPAEDPDTQQAVENILAGLDALEARLYSNAG